MAILLDTHILAWIGAGDKRVSRAAKAAIFAGDEDLFVSAVTAYEFVDLNRRGRFRADLSFGAIIDGLEASVLAYPAECWRIAEGLPLLHRDPVDRMAVAHAIHADFTLITADATIRRYPVRTIW